MTYNPKKPDPGKSPLLDAPTIQGNFAAWASIFANNHAGMNIANQGDHLGVIFTNQSSAPNITQALDVLFNFNAPSATTGGVQPQLFLKVPTFLPTENDTTQSPTISRMQLTYNTVNVAGPQYQSFLSGGYVLYTGTTNATGVVTLSPAPTTILMAIATSNTLAGSLPIIGAVPFQVGTQVLTNSTFRINSTASGSFTITWWALAKQ